MYVWGWNRYGQVLREYYVKLGYLIIPQLGVGCTTNQLKPVCVPMEQRVVSVAFGGCHSLIFTGMRVRGCITIRANFSTAIGSMLQCSGILRFGK